MSYQPSEDDIVITSRILFDENNTWNPNNLVRLSIEVEAFQQIYSIYLEDTLYFTRLEDITPVFKI